MDELKKYCVPYSSLRKLRVYITILMAAIVFVAFKTIRNVYLPFSEIIFNTASVLVAFVLGCVLYFLIKRKIFDKKLKLFESRVQYFKHHEVMDFVLRDFNTGERQLGGSIIVGQDCLIGSNTGMIALYDEIQRIYQEAKDSSNYKKAKEGESSSIYVVCNDQNYQLCAVTLNEIYEREVTQLCKTVNKRNTNFDY